MPLGVIYIVSFGFWGDFVSRPDSRSDLIRESEPVSGCETIYKYSLPVFFFRA